MKYLLPIIEFICLIIMAYELLLLAEMRNDLSHVIYQSYEIRDDISMMKDCGVVVAPFYRNL